MVGDKRARFHLQQRHIALEPVFRQETPLLQLLGEARWQRNAHQLAGRGMQLGRPRAFGVVELPLRLAAVRHFGIDVRDARQRTQCDAALLVGFQRHRLRMGEAVMAEVEHNLLVRDSLAVLA